MKKYEILTAVGLCMIACTTTKPQVATQGSGSLPAEGDYRLNDIWLLTSINGQAVEPAQFLDNKPYIEIHLADNQVLGYAGCHFFRGTISLGKASIRFNPVTDTLAPCPARAFERAFTPHPFQACFPVPNRQQPAGPGK